MGEISENLWASFEGKGKFDAKGPSQKIDEAKLPDLKHKPAVASAPAVPAAPSGDYKLEYNGTRLTVSPIDIHSIIAWDEALPLQYSVGDYIFEAKADTKEISFNGADGKNLIKLAKTWDRFKKQHRVSVSLSNQPSLKMAVVVDDSYAGASNYSLGENFSTAIIMGVNPNSLIQWSTDNPRKLIIDDVVFDLDRKYKWVALNDRENKTLLKLIPSRDPNPAVETWTMVVTGAGLSKIRFPIVLA